MHTLTLLPLSPAGWAAILAGSDALAAHFGHPAADGLCAMYGTGDITQAYFAKLLAPGPADVWLHGYSLLCEGQIIGGCGFKGPPNDAGEVEIAYGLVPSFEGKGLATEAARKLIDIARKDDRVRTILAHTLPVANASGRVLTKCGFVKVGDVIDPDDGPVWRWELPKT